MNYAVTIKCIAKGVYATPKECMKVYESLISKIHGIRCGYDYEKDSIGRWHLHAHFIAQDNLYLLKLQRSGWTIYIRKLPTVDDVWRWVSYMHKKDNEIYQQIALDEYPFDGEQLEEEE